MSAPEHRSSPTPHTVFRTRLSLLVTAVFGGNTVIAAAAAGVSQATIYRLVHGQSAAPRHATVERLASAYNVPVGWLVGDDALLPEEQREPHPVTPTWLALIDRYYEKQQRETLGLVATRRLHGRITDRHLARLDKSREDAKNAVLDMLGFLEASGLEDSDALSAMVAYRAVRELESECIGRSSDV